MKKTLFSSFVLLVLGLAMSSCNKDVVPTVLVNVKVLFPNNYSQPNAVGVKVTLTNKADGAAQTATTDANGTAAFTDVLPGTYDLAASKSLTAMEAQSLTGFAQALELNASRNGVVIMEIPSPLALELRLAGSALGNLVIKEVYYTGSRTAAGGTYFSDQFVEIYNNSTDTIFVDGLCIADVYGAAGQINTTTRPTEFQADMANTYLSSVWRIPGKGKERPLLPGQSIIIAQDGVNHKDPTLNPNSPVDLSKADWETFNERPDNRDADAPAVPNLERLYFTGGFDWLLPVFGPGVIIFRTPDFDKLEKTAIPGSTLAPRIKLPNAQIIDAFEAVQNGNSSNFKRVPTALDAGFFFADDTYNQQSARRKVAATIGSRRVLQDTNNSTNDFQKINAPTPKGF